MVGRERAVPQAGAAGAAGTETLGMTLWGRALSLSRACRARATRRFASAKSGSKVRSSTHHCAKDRVPLIFDSRSA